MHGIWIHRNGIHLGRPAAVNFRHGPRLVSAFRRADFEFIRINPGLASSVQYAVELGQIHRHVGHHHASMMPMVFSVLIHRDGRTRKRGVHLRREPVHLRAQFIHIAARPLGPRQAGRRKQQHSPQQHPAQRDMQATPVLKTIVEPTFWPGIKPQRNPAQRGDPHPRGGQLAVEPTNVTQHQGRMQIINGLA